MADELREPSCPDEFKPSALATDFNGARAEQLNGL
jgi:hypothetical protein